jgi:hypothetical protein
MYRQTGPSKGNRRAPVAAPGRSRPTAQRGGGNKIAEHQGRAANHPGVPGGPRNTPTAASPTVATISPSGAVSGSSPAAVAAAKTSKRRVARAKRAATREERRKAAAALAQVSATRAKRARERANPKTPKPSSYLGRKTAGAPTKAELDQAHESGTLKVNKAGAVTTPSIRQASKQVRQAQRAVAKTTGVTGPLTASQKQIARQVARETGLKPKTVATQELQEMSGDAARRRDAEGNFNTLNIGYFDSGPGSLTKGSEWSSPKTAAKATSEFFKGRKYGPSPAIAAILSQAKGKSAAEQLQIIGNSGWATSDYARNLAATAKLVGERSNPKAKRRLAAANREAKSLGLKPKVGAAAQKIGPAPKKLVRRTVVAEHAMREVEGTPYVWGGGHGAFTAEGGLDCSGAVSYVLHKVEPGRIKAPLTSGSMGQVLDPGPGALTVFYNAEHTFLRLINRKGEAEYWGTSVGDSGAGGLTRHPTPSKSYLAQYNVGHVPGMGKLQALQLGADPAAVSGAGSYAGIEFGGSGGTTATIAPGAAVVKKGKPGRSKRPIALTPLQRYNRAKRKLRAVGAPLSSSSKSRRPESHPILEELKAKYGSAPTSAKQRAAEAASA